MPNKFEKNVVWVIRGGLLLAACVSLWGQDARQKVAPSPSAANVGLTRTELSRDPGAIEQTVQTFRAPVLGFVAGGETGIHRISGIRGASTQQPALELGVEWRQVLVAPSGFAALGITRNDGRPLAVLSLDETPLLSRFDEAPDGAELLALSTTGKAAAFLYPSRKQALVLTAWVGARAVSRWVDIPGGEPVSAIAISDDGKHLLMSQRTGDGDRLSVAAEDNNARDLGWYGAGSLFGFFGDSHDVYVADRSSQTLLRLRDAGSGTAAEVLLRETDGLRDVSAFRATRDNTLLIAAGRETASERNALAVIDINLGTLSLLPCDCTPAGLQSLAGGTQFLINAAGKKGVPAWVLDVRGPQPDLFFVPGLPDKREEK